MAQAASVATTLTLPPGASAVAVRLLPVCPCWATPSRYQVYDTGPWEGSAANVVASPSQIPTEYCPLRLPSMDTVRGVGAV